MTASSKLCGTIVDGLSCGQRQLPFYKWCIGCRSVNLANPAENLRMRLTQSIGSLAQRICGFGADPMAGTWYVQAVAVNDFDWPENKSWTDMPLGQLIEIEDRLKRRWDERLKELSEARR